jgi:dipeptidyl-peptidase-4
MQLGRLESEDQISAARSLAEERFVDENRIAIWGWSYGGFMSTLCLEKGSDVFAAAIAVAPVTNWRYYDSIYTERFMRTPQENEKGYDENSPIKHVDLLKGSLLLCHGTADDNVHIQNTYELSERLVQANKQFEMQVYTNRNHSIYGGNTRLHLYNRFNQFLKEKL